MAGLLAMLVSGVLVIGGDGTGSDPPDPSPADASTTTTSGPAASPLPTPSADQVDGWGRPIDLAADGEHAWVLFGSPPDETGAPTGQRGGLVRVDTDSLAVEPWAAIDGAAAVGTCWTRVRYGTDNCDAERLPADELDAALIDALLTTYQNRNLFERAVDAA